MRISTWNNLSLSPYTLLSGIYAFFSFVVTITNKIQTLYWAIVWAIARLGETHRAVAL